MELLTIDKFTGNFAPLAIDHPGTVWFRGQEYPSAACALLSAWRCVPLKQLPYLQEPWPQGHPSAKAQQLLDACWNEELPEQESWQHERDEVLELILRDKFVRHREAAEALEDSGGRPLKWKGKGGQWLRETLGSCLESVRLDQKRGIAFEIWLSKCIRVETKPEMRPQVTLSEVLPAEKKAKSKTFELKGAYAMIGKSADCAVVAENPTVSRKHALIAHHVAGGGCFVMDLNSTGGTSLNGKRITDPLVPQTLHNGDSLQLARSSRSYLVSIDYSQLRQRLQQRKREAEEALAAAAGARTVVIRNLPYRATSAAIEEWIEQSGPVERLLLLPPAEGSRAAHRGTAIVEFASAEEAAKMLRRNGEFFQGRRVTVAAERLSKADLVPTWKKESSRPQSRSRSRSPSNPRNHHRRRRSD